MTEDEFPPLSRIEMPEDEEGSSLRLIACLVTLSITNQSWMKKITFIWSGQNISFMYDTIGSC